MSSYIVAHYNGTSTAFTPAETLDQAYTVALAISNYQINNHRGIISIVDAVTDEIVYYGRYKKLVARLNPSSENAGHGYWSRFAFIKSFVSALRLKVNGFTFGH